MVQRMDDDDMAEELGLGHLRPNRPQEAHERDHQEMIEVLGLAHLHPTPTPRRMNFSEIAMPINGTWLAEFTAVFEQQIEGEDGNAVGRQLWHDQDGAWRAERANGAALAYADATAEAEEWANS